MAEFDETARNAGRTSAILKRIYEKNERIRYNLKHRLWDRNGGKISDEILEKFQDANDRIEVLEGLIKAEEREKKPKMNWY
jgi:hypothetical protein